MEDLFRKRYEGLNPGQKKAVDTIEGPVMVIAGPGTGKTQVISLRIGNILKKTDTSADGILCLTFTNSGVEAMRSRLREYIGPQALKVEISTFHAFGIKMIEEFYHALGLPQAPKLLDTEDMLALVDRILSVHEWRHIRPRNNTALYFRDLKSLISLLIRERMSPEDFLKEITSDINALKKDPESISSRGARKGELKMEVVNKIEALEKTREVVTFYELYEREKREKNVMDYDDILRYMVTLAAESEDAKSAIRERYLYVLVDEHQDSSGVQNQFLKEVWGEIESPNVFVVGDDRQLIYGFSGASLSYFEEFKNTFAGTTVITLTDNYRSTQRILDAADTLLASTLAEGKLKSQNTHDVPIELVECEYPRDEVIAAGAFFKERIALGTPANECALLVPKNSHVRAAALILRDMGLPVNASGLLRLFDTAEVQSVIRILKIINNPFSGLDIAEIILDPLSGIPALAAHAFLHKTSTRNLSLQTLIDEGKSDGLLAEVNPLYAFGKKLERLVESAPHESVYELLQHVGKDFLLDTALDHESFVRRVEIVRSLLHLELSREEKGEKSTIAGFVDFLNRLLEYGEDIPLAVFGSERGITIKTLHGSKGLEFEAVWIAHMNERALMSGKALGFTLPEKVKLLEEKKDEAVARREVYVAVTRSKRFCTLSYATMNYKGTEERLASIVDMLPQDIFIKRSFSSEVSKDNIEAFVTSAKQTETVTKKELAELVKEYYANKKISVTLLNHFYECPWKWYFRSFLEVPEPLSESLEFGSVVHAAIEHIVRLPKKPTKKDIDTAILEAIEECHIVDESRVKRMTREAEATVKRFVDYLYPELYDRRESEKSLAYKDPKFPKLVIYGKLDLVEQHDGDGIRVTDFKTGKTRKDSEIEKVSDEGRMSTYMRQLAMYSYLVHHSMRGAEVEKSRLYFVEEEDTHKACYETIIDEEKIDLLIQDIKDYDAAMQNGSWTERECHYKPHQGETGCPYCERAKMYT